MIFYKKRIETIQAYKRRRKIITMLEDIMVTLILILIGVVGFSLGYHFGIHI